METYKPTPPTKTQVAANAIRDMFFNKHYKGVVPVKDIEIIKNSNSWIKIYTKRALLEAINQLSEEQYMNLDEKKENWLWGLPGGWHERLFPKEL